MPGDDQLCATLEGLGYDLGDDLPVPLFLSHVQIYLPPTTTHATFAREFETAFQIWLRGRATPWMRQHGAVVRFEVHPIDEHPPETMSDAYRLGDLCTFFSRLVLAKVRQDGEPREEP